MTPSTSTLTDHERLLLSRVEGYVLDCALEIVELEEGTYEPHIELSDLGFDSVKSVELSGYLNEYYGIRLSPTVFYDVHTPRNIAAYLIRQHRSAVLARHAAELPAAVIAELASPQPASTWYERARPTADERLAIVGIGAVLPGSADCNEFWTHLRDGADLITEVPHERWDWSLLEPSGEARHWGGFIAGIELFDAPFFQISPKEAVQMDPQQRLFLQVAWKALEDAGIRPSSLAGSDTGVFVGAGTMDYWELSPSLDGHTATGASHAVLANRLSYLLDLHGPSEALDTACSSSLVALHKAMQAIRLGECGLAIVGGVNAMLTPSLHVALNKAGMLSPDGRCKTFDASANGYVRGEGVGALVLAPLSRAQAEGWPVQAVLLGSAVNHGGHAASLTAPTVEAQARLIECAWRRAGVDPASAAYIEAHGTGTALGDPIEFNALKLAFQRLSSEWGHELCAAASCGIGSVKTNIGHLESAAGIAGLIKVVLAMRHRMLPASLHFHALNPYIALEDSPFFVLDQAQPWPLLKDAEGRAVPLRAGVSSFGFGGVNAHVVLESPTHMPRAAATVADDGAFVLSARDPERLRDYAAAFVRYLEAGQDTIAMNCEHYFRDLLFTLQVGREPMKCRLALVCRDLGGIVQGLAAFLRGQVDWTGLYCSDELSAEPAQGELGALVQSWVSGANVAWPQYAARRLSHLPSYPFAPLRFWCKQGTGLPGKLGLFEQCRTHPAVAESADLAAAVTAIFCEVLGFEEIAPDLSFAEMGADSILAAQIRELIVRRLRVDLSLGRMLESATLAGLIRLLESQKRGPIIVNMADSGGRDAGMVVDDEIGAGAALLPRPTGQNPLSQAQAQFCFLEQLSPANPAFILPGALRITGPFQVEQVRQAYALAHEHHESLRTRFVQQAGESVPELFNEVEPLICFRDMTELLPYEQQEQVEALLRETARKPLPLDQAPLSRLLILSLGDEEHILLLCMHHVIADFSALGRLLNDLAMAGLGHDFVSAPTLQHGDYAWWEQQHLGPLIERQLPYWRERLADLPGPLPLPFDRPRPARPNYRGAVQKFSLKHDTALTLQAFAKQRQLSVFVVLLAAFNCWLYRLSGRLDSVVGSPYANRLQAETHDMLGPLAYALILRSPLQVEDTFETVLSRVRETLYEAFDHLYVPYTRLVEVLNPQRVPGCNPLFQVMLNVIPMGSLADELEPRSVDTGYSDYDLSMRLQVRCNEVQGFLQYSLELFDAETARQMAESFCALLDEVLHTPVVRLDQLRLREQLDHAERTKTARPLYLNIASTFTDRPLEPALHLWEKHLGRPLEVSFAGYNQVFQMLLNPQSVFFQADTDCNLILWRSVDWLRFELSDDPSIQRQRILDNLQDLADAILQALPQMQAPLVLLMLPDELQADALPLRAKLAELLGEQANVLLFDSQAIATDYPVETVFDALADEAGHVPFTLPYYSAIGAFVSRWIAQREGIAEQSPWQRPIVEIQAELERAAKPAGAVTQAQYVAARNPLEQQLVEAFQQVLELERVGIDDDFFEAGGHSLAAIRLLYLINEACSARLSVAEVFMAPSPRQLAKRIESGPSKPQRVDLAHEACLDERIQPCTIEVPMLDQDNILLTGGTGFVGRFLLRELLDRTRAQIYCLARGRNAEEVCQRIRQTMQQWRLWRDGDEARLVGLPGDLTLPRLGLADEDYRWACREIGVIYHNATSMNHLESFQAAKLANVDGVTELLRLTTEGRPKTFNYVSTLGVFSALDRTGTLTFDETSTIEHEQHLIASGYTSSKWVGEQLVLLASARGVPCNVYRLGLVTGDSLEGRYDELQSFFRLIKSAVLMGAAFTDYRYDLVITPVDYVAKAMVFLGQRYRQGGGVFHLSSMEVTPMGAVFAGVNRLVQAPLEILPHFTWLQRVKALYQQGLALPIIPLVQGLMNLSESEIDQLSTERQRTTLIYDCRRTQRELEAAGIHLPPFDERLLFIYLRGLLAQDVELRESGKFQLKALCADGETTALTHITECKETQ